MTSEQRQALKLAIDAKRRQATATAPNAIRHGTWYGYSHQRCRCADCSQAMRLYTATRVATNRKKKKAVA